MKTLQMLGPEAAGAVAQAAGVCEDRVRMEHFEREVEAQMRERTGR